MKDTKIVINQLEWDELERRNEVPCKDCGKLTRGRIGEDAVCLGCALQVMMKRLSASTKLKVRGKLNIVDCNDREGKGAA